MLLLLAVGCLFDSGPYEARVAALTDDDRDGYARADDCDDADAGVHPGAVETCDGVDEDCDGAVDDGAVDEGAWYPDVDADDFGAADAAPVVACDAPAGHVANALDCDDAATDVHPGAAETPYDGVDDDCDGADLTDVDGDGHPATAAGGDDCDDTDPAVSPSATEEPYDGVDQDCSGADADDLDADGHPAQAAGGDDCDDADPAKHPGAPETWADGFTDNDCDGTQEPARLEYGAEVWVGEGEGDQAGRRVTAVGDLSGDGLAEFLVGAVYAERGHPSGGAVYLVPGGARAGSLTDVNVLLPGGPDWYLPQSLGALPDVDGDGILDVAVGAAGADGFTGAAFLVSGAGLVSTPEQSLPEAAFARLSGEAAGDLAGTAVAALGDVMGDGGEYLGVGALLAPYDGSDGAGRISVFDLHDLGDRTLSDGVLVAGGPYAGAGVGNHLGPAGDIDGDGIGDFLVTASSGDLAYVLPGGRTRLDLDDDALFRLTATEAGEVGEAEMLGDVDGDGSRDLGCVVDLGEVRVFTTLRSARVRTVEESSALVTIGEGSVAYDLLDLGDRDGDGRAETLVPVQTYAPLGTSLSAIVAGADLDFRATVDVGSVALTAVAVRPEARFAYRVDLSADVDGDGGDDLLVAGYSDDEAGDEAGAVAVLPVPR